MYFSWEPTETVNLTVFFPSKIFNKYCREGLQQSWHVTARTAINKQIDEWKINYLNANT